MEPIWALGLMSGTSLDGVDAAWLYTDGQKIIDVGEGFMVPYPETMREKLRSLLGESELTPTVTVIEKEITEFHAHVVQQAKEKQTFDLVGFHGQTLYHAPPRTLQIGDGRLLAQLVGIEVVYDFRSLDVANGGQGAPLVPIFHQAIINGDHPVVILNVGGVANITWIQKGHSLIACDTGPGGALLDDWVCQKTGQAYDQDGHLGTQGTPDEKIVQQWLRHPYLAKPAPKSLDRDHFRTLVKDISHLSPQDGAATLVEFTARCVAHAMTQLPMNPQKLYVAGGGRRNKHLMGRLSSLLSCPVETIESLGWNGDLIEAYAFAYLAARVKAGLPTSFPTTTGVSHPVCGGQIAKK